MTLIVKSLNQLLDEPADDERGEAEYRRGGADVIGKLFMAVEALPADISKSDLEDALWRYWHTLLRWSHATLSTDIEPPGIEWPGSCVRSGKSLPAPISSPTETTAKRLDIKVW